MGCDSIPGVRYDPCHLTDARAPPAPLWSACALCRAKPYPAPSTSVSGFGRILSILQARHLTALGARCAILVPIAHLQRLVWSICRLSVNPHSL
jgi:hypothetical protein